MPSSHLPYLFLSSIFFLGNFLTQVSQLTKLFLLLLLLFSHLAMSYSLEPHGLQHARPSCPLPSPRVCSSSYSLHCFFSALSVLACLTSITMFITNISV